MAVPSSGGRKLIITLEEEVNLGFLLEYPCSTDRARLFGRLELARLHRQIGEKDARLAGMLTETAGFFLDEAAPIDAVDDNLTNRMSVTKGQRLKDELRRFAILQQYDLRQRA